MPARDFLHNIVRTALEKDGWTITHDPLTLPSDDRRFTLFVDLAAERILAAERDSKKIAVEVKSFIGASLINEFHLTLGQILNYRTLLNNTEPQRTLYLAISNSIYDTLFTADLVQTQISQYSIHLIIVSPDREEIVEWKH